MCECRSVFHDEHIDNMYLKWVTNHLLFFTFIYLHHTDAESIRAVKGETVRLPCHSLLNDSVEVSVEWINSATSKTICKWKFYTNSESYNTMQCIPHVSFNRTSLSIENVQFSDSGNYSCKTTRLIPPPSLDNISHVKLQVEGPPSLSLLKLNVSNVSCVHLLCSLEAPNPEPVNFTWIRAGHGSLYSSTSYDMKSSLELCKPDWSDGDTIICHASYSINKIQTQLILNSEYRSDKALLLILCSAAAAGGLVLCIILIVVICKCKKRNENGSIVFSNKVYENFSFAMARQNSQATAKPQPEECIYEN
ncbi:hypothetical protein F2P79_002065 [Pimephales promelas]|nr:hypothetical protein F2P79_002065 [Pimephales promelas]